MRLRGLITEKGSPESSGSSTPRRDTRKDMLRQAAQMASRGEHDEAFDLFRACIQTYLDTGLPMRALAAAKAARSALGITPRLQALLIQLYHAAGLYGEADKELQSSLKYLGIDKISFFQKMSQEEVLHLLEAMDVQTFGKGEAVFQPGGRCADIFVILSGDFEVCRDQHHQRSMHRGDIFGAIGVSLPGTSPAMVRASDHGTLIRLKASFFRQLLDRYPAIPHVLRTIQTERRSHEPDKDVQVGADDLTHMTGLSFPKGTKVRDINGLIILKLAHDLVHVSEVTIPKGMAIPAFDGITILKYGTVEIDYNEPGLPKQYIRPGHVLQFSGDFAMASTNVRLIRAKQRI